MEREREILTPSAPHQTARLGLTVAVPFPERGLPLPSQSGFPGGQAMAPEAPCFCPRTAGLQRELRRAVPSARRREERLRLQWS